ncbi:MAG: hypothetical protein ACRBFS_06275 [Aureispira sp.]
MRTFKFLLASIALLFFVTVSCTKPEAEQQATETIDDVTFVSKNAVDEKKAMQLLKEFETVSEAKGGDGASKGDNKGTGTVTSAVECCAVSSLSLKQWTPTFVNLNVQFTMGMNDLEVRVLHYTKNATGGWNYYGYSKIINNDPSCIEDGVNMGTMHLPSGDHLAIARVWDLDDSWCGSPSNFLFWTNP